MALIENAPAVDHTLRSHGLLYLKVHDNIRKFHDVLKAQWRKTMKMDVEESLNRIRTELRLVSDHITEEDWTTLWRNEVILKVHSA